MVHLNSIYKVHLIREKKTQLKRMVGLKSEEEKRKVQIILLKTLKKHWMQIIWQPDTHPLQTCLVLISGDTLCNPPTRKWNFPLHILVVSCWKCWVFYFKLWFNWNCGFVELNERKKYIYMHFSLTSVAFVKYRE